MTNYRQSLFFYIKFPLKPYRYYYRITVFTWKPIEEYKLAEALNYYIEEDYTEKSSYSYEEEEVLSAEAKGIGFYNAVIHKSENRIPTDEEEIGRFSWSYYEKIGVRLRPAEFLAVIRAYGKVKRIWERAKATIVSFWEWSTH